MNKSLAKKGLIVLAVSIILFVIVSVSITSSSPYGGQNSSNVSLSQGKYYYVPLAVNSSDMLTFFFQSTNVTTFILLNSSGFSAFKSAYSDTGRFPKFQSLEGVGLIEGVSNATSGSFPYAAPSNSSSYSNENASILQSGTYYAIFYNPKSPTSEIYYVYGTSSETVLVLQGLTSILTILLFVAGLIIVIYALVKGPGKTEITQNDQSRAMIEAEYNRIENAEKPKGSSVRRKQKKKRNV